MNRPYEVVNDPRKITEGLNSLTSAIRIIAKEDPMAPALDVLWECRESAYQRLLDLRRAETL